MSSWNYRMTRETVEEGGEKVYLFAVREIYYGDDGSLSWTADPIAPTGESWWEMADTLARFSTLANQPILDIDTRTWIKQGRSADVRRPAQ